MKVHNTEYNPKNLYVSTVSANYFSGILQQWVTQALWRLALRNFLTDYLREVMDLLEYQAFLA
jgi:hypothetical protein